MIVLILLIMAKVKSIQDRTKKNENDIAEIKDSLALILEKLSAKGQKEDDKPTSLAPSSKCSSDHDYSKSVAGPSNVDAGSKKRFPDDLDEFERPLPHTPKKRKPNIVKRSLIDQDTVTRVVHEVSSDSEKEELSDVAQALVNNDIKEIHQAVDNDVLSIPDEEEMQDEMSALYSSLVSVEEPEGFRPGMCNIIGEFFRGKVKPEMVQKYANEFPVPDNCPNLKVPRVNEPIWNNLSHGARVSDLSIQTQQNELSVGASCVAHCIHRLQNITQNLPSDTAKQVSAVTYDLGKALTLFGSSFNHSSTKRRRDMRQCLNPVMFPLLKDDYPVGTDFLFGDDLSGAMRDVNDARRVTNQVAKKAPLFQQRGKQFNRRGRLMSRPYFPQQSQSQNRFYQNQNQNQTQSRRFFPQGRGQKTTRGRGRFRRGAAY